MDKQEIIEGNILLAEFMQVPERKGIAKPGIRVFDYGDKLYSDLEYHSNWSWLMPVVESIPKLNPDNGKIHFEYEISRCHCKIWSSRQNQWKNNWDTTIGATWKTVVEFVKWYNSQKQ